MSGLVSGYSGIIAPPNLATNGSFRINQRGTFSTLTPAKSGDYISDCWYLHGDTNVDYLEVANNTTHGHVDFSGYGKKGQTILIFGRDTHPYGHTFAQSNPIYDSIQIPSTACVSVINYKIPITVAAAPRYNSVGDTWLITESEATTYFGAGKAGDTKPMITKHKGSSIDGGGFIRIILQEDGEYGITLACYRDLAGAFKNPPKYAPVHYADDLARCQRYYQKGKAQTYSLAANIGGNYRLGIPIQFIPVMAAVPTFSIEGYSVIEEGDAGSTNVGGSYFFSNLSARADGVTAHAGKSAGGSKPAYMSIGWTAEVV